MNPAFIVTGAAVLFLGRQLFWLFVAVVGFSLGLSWAQSALAPQPLWVIWAVGLAAGLAGALLAYFIQKLAIAVSGFLAGIHIAMGLAALAGHHPGWPAGLIAGILGAVLLYIFFDWALIALSSAAGAILIIEGLPDLPMPQWASIWGLTLLGAVCQVIIWRRRPDRLNRPT